MSVYITREMVRRAAHEHKRDKPYSLFGSMARSLARKWQRRKAIAQLEAMDDYLLKDIGINRSDIRRVVNEPYGRHPTPARPASAIRPDDHRPEGTTLAGAGIAPA